MAPEALCSPSPMQKGPITNISSSIYSSRMKSLPTISVIVTTYDWPEALERVLDALNEQIYTDFEVLIADDGSGPITQQLVKQYQKNYRVPLHHIWHQDLGFRASAIRNRGIAASKGEYIIFLDGDCIPRPHFVERHAHLATPQRFVTGNRILLSKLLTEQTLAKQETIHRYNLIKWLAYRIQGKINRILPLLNFPFSIWRNYHPTQWKKAISCNLAVWKNDLIQVNGFDETFIGWGYEDSDLVLRLIHSGIFRREGRYSTGVFHLWHEERERDQTESNLTRLKETLKNLKTTATEGLNQYNIQENSFLQ